jgi:hypothetical protein
MEDAWVVINIQIRFSIHTSSNPCLLFIDSIPSRPKSRPPFSHDMGMRGMREHQLFMMNRSLSKRSRPPVMFSRPLSDG